MQNKRGGFKVLCMLIFPCIPSLYAAGIEKKIVKSDLPPAVAKAADIESRNATVIGYSEDNEGGKRVYEVEMKTDGHSRDVTIASDGTILEVEEEVEFGALEPQIQKALKQRAGKATITKVESLTRKGKLVGFEAQIKSGSRHSEIQVDGTGAPQPER